jgi:hypothetical protein
LGRQRDKELQLTDMRLRETHTLVNSDMTAARTAELNQTKVTLGLLKKVIVLNKNVGLEPSEEDQAVVLETEARIGELAAILADRAAQQRLVDAGKAT